MFGVVGAPWYLWHGDWWMVQFQWAGWLSLGLHVDFRRRPHSGLVAGPLVDLHLGPFIFSVGRNCYLAFEFDINSVRGGRG